MTEKQHPRAPLPAHPAHAAPERSRARHRPTLVAAWARAGARHFGTVGGHFVLACLLVGALTATTALAQQPPRADVTRMDYRLQARALASGVWVVEGDNADFSVANGCNIINTGFMATGVGVVMINTGTSRLYGQQLRALIARTTAEPVVRVVHLNQHPDYFLGNQAFGDVPRAATATTRAGIAAEASAYESNLYRLCGDWMLGTEALVPSEDIDPVVQGGRWRLGNREFEWLHLAGHTASDLVLVERNAGVAFVGGLAFSKRIPTTPHADVLRWQQSLKALAPLRSLIWVPSHGPVFADGSGWEETSAYLAWLDQHFSQAAAQGWDMNELLRAPVPNQFRQWAAFQTEFVRNVAHLYPRYEQQVLRAGQILRR